MNIPAPVSMGVPSGPTLSGGVGAVSWRILENAPILQTIPLRPPRVKNLWPLLVPLLLFYDLNATKQLYQFSYFTPWVLYTRTLTVSLDVLFYHRGLVFFLLRFHSTASKQQKQLFNGFSVLLFQSQTYTIIHPDNSLINSTDLRLN